MIVRRASFAFLSTGLLLGLAWGCAASDDPGNTLPASGGSTSLVDSGNPDLVLMPGGGRQNSGRLRQNPLCDPREDAACVPDSPISCRDYVPPAPPPSDEPSSGGAAASAQAGAKGESGAGGDSAVPTDSSRAGDGGESGTGGEGGAAGAAGASGPNTGTTPKYGCHVQRIPTAPTAAFSRCSLAGPGAENAPCLTSSDCQAGLGCIGDQNAGSCQRFCCQDANDCAQGTYCAERPLRDAITNASTEGAANISLVVPVCVHAENCDLGAPYPCPKGSECACKSGTACVVVRPDGTTTCAVPGTGTVGQACPCAWGHVCSAATGQCLKLCYTRDSGTCGDGRCQSAAELPDGWGVCIGAALDGG